MLKTEFGQHRQQQDGVGDQIDGAIFSDGKNTRKHRKGTEPQEHYGDPPAKVVRRVPIECSLCAHESCSREFSSPFRGNRFSPRYGCLIFPLLTKSEVVLKTSPLPER